MPLSDTQGDRAFIAREGFATTHWSVVLAAGNKSSPAAHEALERLCRTYWYPLYAYVRRRGHPPETAADLTQICFEQLLGGEFFQRAQPAKGRFRNYLLGAMNRVLRDERQRGNRQKRGGGHAPISLDALDAENRYLLEPVDPQDPELIFLRRWAMTILQEAFDRLAEELARSGKEVIYRRLEGYLGGEKSGGSYAQAAVDLQTTEAAVKMTVTRLRNRLRELLRETIAQTVSTPTEADEEYRALIRVLGG